MISWSVSHCWMPWQHPSLWYAIGFRRGCVYILQGANPRAFHRCFASMLMRCNIKRGAGTDFPTRSPALAWNQTNRDLILRSSMGAILPLSNNNTSYGLTHKPDFQVSVGISHTAKMSFRDIVLSRDEFLKLPGNGMNSLGLKVLTINLIARHFMDPCFVLDPSGYRVEHHFCISPESSEIVDLDPALVTDCRRTSEGTAEV